MQQFSIEWSKLNFRIKLCKHFYSRISIQFHSGHQNLSVSLWTKTLTNSTNYGAVNLLLHQMKIAKVQIVPTSNNEADFHWHYMMLEKNASPGTKDRRVPFRKMKNSMKMVSSVFQFQFKLELSVAFADTIVNLFIRSIFIDSLNFSPLFFLIIITLQRNKKYNNFN